MNDRQSNGKIQKTVWLSKPSWQYVHKEAYTQTVQAGRRVSDSEVIDKIIQDEMEYGKRNRDKT